MKVSALGVEEQRVNVVVDFTTPAEKRMALGDGYRVEVRVITWSTDDALQVSTGSLFRHGEEWAVFTVEEGRARLRTIQLGHRNDLSAEVLKGLSEGSQVIAHPSEAISDGVRVSRRQS
jgi:HlyD family secretion protein